MSDFSSDRDARLARQAVEDATEYASLTAEAKRLRANMWSADQNAPVAWIFLVASLGSVFSGEMGAPFLVFGLVAAAWLYIQRAGKHETLQQIERIERRAALAKARLDEIQK